MNMAYILRTPKYKYWHQGTIECYERNCICEGCPTYDLIGKNCKMKYAVLNLIKNNIKPDKEIINTVIEEKEEMKGNRNMTITDNDLNLQYPDYLQDLIIALKNGYSTYAELERETGKTSKTLSVYINGFFKLLYSQGLIENTKNSRRIAVNDWITARLLTQNQRAKIELEKPLKNEYAELKAKINELETANKKLKNQVKELQQVKKVDFSEMKLKIQTQINELKQKLELITDLENSF